MPRLFVAIDLPEPLKDQLADLCPYGLQGTKWVDPDQFHLSLRFIGEVNETEFDDIANSLVKIKAKPFKLRLKGVGTFPAEKNPRVIWAGVEKEESLLHLQKKVETRLNQIGLQKERKRYSPHITLARVKSKKPVRIGDFLVQYNLFQSEAFAVDTFHLFSSRLTPKGAIYTKEQAYQLI